MAFSSKPRIYRRGPGVLLHLHVIDRDMMDRDYQRGRVSHREDTKIGASAEIGRNAATAGLRRSGARARDAIVFIISLSLIFSCLSDAVVKSCEVT